MSLGSSIGRLLILGIVFSGCHQAPKIPPVQPPASYRPNPPEEWHLDNGLTVMLIPDRSTPQVQGMLFIKGGSLFEQESEVGQVGMMAGQMRVGGSGALNPEAVDERLADLAAKIGVSWGREFGLVSFQTLKPVLPEVFSLFADVVLRPQFNESRLALAKATTIERIKRRIDDPDAIAATAMSELVLGPAPYGGVETSATVQRISRLDLLRWHRKLIRPNEATLVLIGDVGRAEIDPLIAKAFAEWPHRESPLPKPVPLTFRPQAGIYFIPGSFSQSTIYIADQGVPRLTPDHIAIDVFNDLVGSNGFTSFLAQRIRTELGLAYVVSGEMSRGSFGINEVAVQTKSETTGEAIQAIFDVLREAQKKFPSQDQLTRAKDTVANGFVFTVDTPENFVSRLVQQRMAGYPPDFDAYYLDEVAKVSAEDIREIARKHWHLNHMVVIVVGNETAYTELQKLAQNPPAELVGTQLIRGHFDEKFHL